MTELRRPAPVETLTLYPEERAELLTLLAGLGDDAWNRPTICPGWSVRDVALHVLADDLGVVSRQRDGYRPQAPRPGETLPIFLNRINDEWVQATRRLSGRVIVDLLRASGEQMHAHYAALDPLALGSAVSWAGPDPAPIWLDIAREYTERWVHQQQIREAVSAPLLLEARWLGPVLATFVRALPVTFSAVAAPAGTTVTLTLDGEGGSVWTVARSEDGRWKLFEGRPEATPTAEARLPGDTAWRLFTKGLTPEAAAARATLSGDQALARQALQTVSIIA